MQPNRILMLIGLILLPFIGGFAETQTTDMQQKIEQLRLLSNQTSDQAKECDQNAADEDRLALTGPSWARAVHQLAAVKFRDLAAQNRESARQYLAQAQELERQNASERSPALPAQAQVRNAAAPVVPPPPPTQGGVGLREDYLNMNDDPSTIEHSIEVYLNRNNMHAQVVTGNNGQTHYVQLSFRNDDGGPNMTYRLSAGDQGSNALGRWRSLLVTMGTNLKVQKSDAVYSTLDEANKSSHCAWFMDTDNELMCRSWPILPNPQYSVPTDQILSLVRFINGDWAKIYPKINNALKAPQTSGLVAPPN